MTSTPLDQGEPAGSTEPSRRKEQTLEVCVFLFLIVPSMAFSLFAVRQGQLSFVLAANATILRDLALVCLILFFLWRNGELRHKIGWTLSRVWREAALGLALFIPFLAGVAGAEWVWQQAGLRAPATPLPAFLTAQDLPQVLLALILVIVVAFSEETIFRGYLLLRFGATMRSTGAAVIASSLIFALGHGYEGTAGLATVAVMGIMLALVYLWRRSLVAPVVIHFLQDFVSIVLVPTLAMK
jgi:membrane protease YdiL (CAAX protease family)